MNKIDISKCENGSLQGFSIGRIDHIDSNKVNDIITTCIQKLSYGEILHFQFLCLDSFCKEYMFKSKENVEKIMNLRSLHNIENIKQIANQLNCKIKSIKMKDSIYDIRILK